MRTVLIPIVLALLVLISPIQAGNLTFGIKGGAVSSQLHRDYTTPGLPDPDRYTGWSGGFFAEYAFGDLISAQLGFRYVQRGMSFTVYETTEAYPEGTGRVLQFRGYLGYLSAPLTLRARTDLGPLTASLIAGPRVDFKVHSHADYVTEATFELLKDVSLGYTLGGALEYQTGQGWNLFVETVYNRGFGNLYETPTMAITIDAVDILAGIRFGI